MLSTPPPLSIERFAEVTAQLSAAFADPGAVLGQAGLNAERFRQVEAYWAARLGEAGSEPVRARFASAFAEARLGAASVEGQPISTERDARFLSEHAQPWREEAASVPLCAEGAAPPNAERVSAIVESSADRTIECPAYPAPGPVLPFVESAPASPLRGRLHRFDPQTGLPLPVAVWVELPQMPSLKP